MLLANVLTFEKKEIKNSFSTFQKGKKVFTRKNERNSLFNKWTNIIGLERIREIKIFYKLYVKD